MSFARNLTILPLWRLYFISQWAHTHSHEIALVLYMPTSTHRHKSRNLTGIDKWWHSHCSSPCHTMEKVKEDQRHLDYFKANMGFFFNTKWDKITDAICGTAGVSVWQRYLLATVQAQPRTKTSQSRCLAFPHIPDPPHSYPVHFFSIIAQQITTKWETAFVAESTESVSNSPIGDPPFTFFGGLSQSAIYSICMTLRVKIALSATRIKRLEKHGLA